MLNSKKIYIFSELYNKNQGWEGGSINSSVGGGGLENELPTLRDVIWTKKLTRVSEFSQFKATP